MDKLKSGTKVLVTGVGDDKDFSEAEVIAHSVEHQKVRVAFEFDTDYYTFPESRIIVIGD